MTPIKLAPLLAAALAASACSVRIGNGQADGNATVDVSAPGNGSDARSRVTAASPPTTRSCCAACNCSATTNT